MKVVDCKVVSREIDELDRDQQPRAAILAHTENCAQCRSFYATASGCERWWRVARRRCAFGFDFRLRARLANEKASLFPRRACLGSAYLLSPWQRSLCWSEQGSQCERYGTAGNPPVAVNDHHGLRSVTTPNATTSTEVNAPTVSATNNQSDTVNVLCNKIGSKSAKDLAREGPAAGEKC